MKLLRRCCIGLMSASACCSVVQAEGEGSDALSRLRFGTILYDFYQADPLTTLTTISLREQQGLSEQEARQAELLFGGVSILYDMPKVAEQKLQSLMQSDNSLPTQIQARYWMTRLYFEQGRLQQAEQSYQQLQQLMGQADDDGTSVLSEQQWTRLHYQAAHARLLRSDNEFPLPLNSGHIEHFYLLYNQAVVAFREQQFDRAVKVLQQARQGLLSFASEPDFSALELFWASEPAITDSQRQEADALLQQVLLVLGQAYLSQGKLAQATDVFGHMSGQILTRDEALLAYGWALAQADNWPLAMGIWQFLTQQPDNLFTLQARHALAMGYVQGRGYQQAFQQLDELNQQLSHAMDSLMQLRETVTQDEYWLAVAQAVTTSDSSISATAWPSVHRDILRQIVTESGQDGGETLLQQLLSVDVLSQTLQAQQQQVEQFEWLVAERQQEHQLRVTSISTENYAERIVQLSEAYAELQQKYQIAVASIEAKSVSDDALNGLAILADTDQLDALQRLQQAQGRLRRLQQANKAKPGYAERLARIEGRLVWQLSEQYSQRIWAFKQHLTDMQAQLEQANHAVYSLQQSMRQPEQLALQANRVNGMREQVAQQRRTCKQLMSHIHQQLTGLTLAKLEQRYLYLQQQQQATQLAMLQLQDGWQPPGSDTDKQVEHD